MSFEDLDDDQLRRASGGIDMKLTQYGYRNDPYMDSQTAKGNGAYRRLEAHESIAMTDSALHALGVTRSQVRKTSMYVDVFSKKGGGLLTTRRIDDRAPQREMRADLYQPGGFDHSLPDSANVVLHRR
jgi:hypothetical protein